MTMRRRVSATSPIENVLERLTRTKQRKRDRCDLHGLARPGVAPYASGTPSRQKGAESGDLDAPASPQLCRDDSAHPEQRVHNSPGVGSRHLRAGGQGLDELCLVHAHPLVTRPTTDVLGRGTRESVCRGK